MKIFDSFPYAYRRSITTGRAGGRNFNPANATFIELHCSDLPHRNWSGRVVSSLITHSDNTECLAFERYRDSQALLDHHKNLGDTMAAILRTCSGSGEICGTPSPELIEQLKDSPVQVYKPFQAN